MVHIQPLHIIFTSDNTTVSAAVPSLSGPHLVITVQARGDGTNIDALKVNYFNHNATPPRIQTTVSDAQIFHSITHYMQGTGTTLVEKCDTYMNQLPSDDVAIIRREYGRYFAEGRILDGYVAGLASYLGLLLLFEHGAFSAQMPFQFNIPTTVSSGNSMNRNMFSYVTLPLVALAKVATGVLAQIVTFVQSFINMWDMAFKDGPEIGSKNETRMCLEIITGLTQHTSDALAQIERDRSLISQTIAELGKELRNEMSTHITLFRRELSNMHAEARTSVTEVSEKVAEIQEALGDRITRSLTEAGKGYSGPDRARLDKLEQGIEVLNRTLENVMVYKETPLHNPFDVRKRTGPSPYITHKKPIPLGKS